MGVVTGIVTFLIIWWTVLFATLPLWVRSQTETGAVVEGSEPGAPERPHLWRKFALTTAVTFAIWLAVFAVIELKLVRLADLPGGPPVESLDQ